VVGEEEVVFGEGEVDGREAVVVEVESRVGVELVGVDLAGGLLGDGVEDGSLGVLATAV